MQAAKPVRKGRIVNLTMRQIGLFAAALALAAPVGCSREAEKPAASTPEAQPVMKDPAFRAKLTEQAKERGALAAARGGIVAKMAEMIEAKKKALGTGDEAKLKAELEKDPEWNELCRRCEDANTAIREQRRRTAAAVRERMAKKAVPERGGDISKKSK